MAQVERFPGLSGVDVARFLGRAEDERLIELADLHITQVAAFARAYTRGAGWLIESVDVDNGVLFAEPCDEIAAVIVMSTARLVVNPSQVTRESADGYDVTGSFQGFTLTERLVLDRYRSKAG